MAVTRSAMRRRLARAQGLCFSRTPVPFLSLAEVAPALCQARERTPRPARQLTLAQLLGHTDRVLQVLLGLVQTAQLALRDPPLRPCIRQLPPRPQLAEDRDPAVEAGQ